MAEPKTRHLYRVVLVVELQAMVREQVEFLVRAIAAELEAPMWRADLPTELAAVEAVQLEAAALLAELLAVTAALE